MNTNRYNDDELERWAEQLPRLGPDHVSHNALNRVSIGVAARIAKRGFRLERWFSFGQPVLTAGITVVLAGWLLLYHPTNITQTLKTETAGSDLIASLAPLVNSTSLNQITADDIDSLMLEVAPELNTNQTDLASAVVAIEFDEDDAIDTMTPAEQAKILESLASDRKLDWSEML